MTDATRRTALKYALGAAAAGATMTSMLDRAYGQERQARLALRRGGYLVLERGEQFWHARVVGPEGEDLRAATGLVQTEEAGVFALDEGRVLDGTVREGGFSQHSQHSQHTEVTSEGAGRMTLQPAWRRQPVLASQRELLLDSGVLDRGAIDRAVPSDLQQVRPELRERINPNQIDPGRLNRDPGE
ncbi:hypothetical protein DDZ18_03205 [Marinicauda salina]|uniref:Uncharacterized protein n=1 Tax=Marinicauda salina TaxID=2135793 RepID=A0A2U2BXC7_9PROT|nr:hypothetical protein [Marinicauda salina]PWE18624.1 hypothetical protein DDZ18_03205 [Marinicauda salina]